MQLGRCFKTTISKVLGRGNKKIVKPPKPPVIVTPPPPVDPPVDGTIDNSIHAPVYTLASNTAYPIAINFLLDETIVQDTDTLEINVATDRNFATLLANISRPLTAANLNLSPYTDSTLATIVSPTQTYIRARIKRGTMYSVWGKLIKHGDSTPATITSAATASFPELQPVLFNLGANEFVTWTLIGGDAALLEIVNGNQIRIRNNAVPVFPTKSTYTTTVVATDDAGNKTNQLLTFTIISADRIPKQFSFTPLTAQEANSVVMSSEITIEELGTDVTQAGTVSGPVQYSTDSGATWQAAGPISVANGTKVRFRGTTGNFSTGFAGTLTINGVTSTWNVAVKDNPVGVRISSGVQPISTNATDYSTTQCPFQITTSEAGELWIQPIMNQFRQPLSATLNGQPMDLVESRSITNHNGAVETLQQYKKSNVPAGTHTIVVTYDAYMGNTFPLGWFVVNGHGTPAPVLFYSGLWADGGASPNHANYQYETITIPPNHTAAVILQHLFATSFTQMVTERGKGDSMLVGTQVETGIPQAAVSSGGQDRWFITIFPPA